MSGLGRRLAHSPVLQLTRARVVEFLREPEAIFWVFLFPVLLAVALGVAFRAKPAVAAAADARLDHADLTALLYAQGYTGGEIVRG